MVVPPTTAQQRAIAYAPMPFAAISFLSSSYVIYHLLFQERHKLKRLYHRFVLAMNFALLPLSFTYGWSTLMVPKGTPNYVGAMGTVNTCTAGGVISLVFGFAVSTYYGSLVLQAFLGMRNNFKEEKYRWIEIPVHIVAYCIPIAYAIIIVATENFNPSASGCWITGAPRGCESDPDVECQRGKDIKNLVQIPGFSQIFLYFIYPPAVILAMWCWIKRKQRMEASSTTHSHGMSILRENARKEMISRVYRQISVYLFAFWSTWVLSLANNIYLFRTGELVYNLTILANCIFALQGFIFMVVYFTLQKMGERPKEEHYLRPNTTSSRASRQELTVSDIRSNTRRKRESSEEVATNDLAESFSFNVFDGVPDPDSPWARFFDQSDHSVDDDPPEGGEQALPN
mmetsp:Transcript_1233/g.2683  ORF Transcript_1233/g.2683 Transcript_1233/m.2683 type:complete len:400 (-) Transcript_1233:37-1236(-)